MQGKRVLQHAMLATIAQQIAMQVEIQLMNLVVFKCLNGQPLEYIALNVILRETEPIYGA
jgi:hypothetical protein